MIEIGLLSFHFSHFAWSQLLSNGGFTNSHLVRFSFRTDHKTLEYLDLKSSTFFSLMYRRQKFKICLTFRYSLIFFYMIEYFYKTPRENGKANIITWTRLHHPKHLLTSGVTAHTRNFCWIGILILAFGNCFSGTPSMIDNLYSDQVGNSNRGLRSAPKWTSIAHR